MPARNQLLGVWKEVAQLSEKYDTGIVCEVTPASADYEGSMRIEAEEGGYQFAGEPNVGFAYVFLEFQRDLADKRDGGQIN